MAMLKKSGKTTYMPIIMVGEIKNSIIKVYSDLDSANFEVEIKNFDNMKTTTNIFPKYWFDGSEYEFCKYVNKKMQGVKWH